MYVINTDLNESIMDSLILEVVQPFVNISCQEILGVLSPDWSAMKVVVS